MTNGTVVQIICGAEINICGELRDGEQAHGAHMFLLKPLERFSVTFTHLSCNLF